MAGSSLLRKPFLSAMALLASYCVFAQTVEGVSVSGVTLTHKGDSMVVDATMDLRSLNIKSCEAAILTPFITDGNHSVHLPNIGIYGRSRYFLQKRNNDLGISGKKETVYRKDKAPDVIPYHTAVPYKDWMDGSLFVLRRHDFACNTELRMKQEQAIAQYTSPEPPPVKYTLLYATSGDALSPKTRTHSGTAYVDFPINKTEVDENFGRNPGELSKIRASIDSIRSDSDVTITSVKIKGYASPDGNYKRNTRLAKGRTESLSRYVQKIYSFPEGTLVSEYEPEDWVGFRRMIEGSDLHNRSEMLAIIDGNLSPDEKEYALKTKYPKQYTRIKNEIYPSLRHSDYSIEYTIRSFEDPSSITKMLETSPHKVSLREIGILESSLEKGSPQFRRVCLKAAELFPEDYGANLNAASCLIAEGDLDKAESYLEKAGDSPETTYMKAVLKYRQGSLEDALSLSRKAESEGLYEAKDLSFQLEALINYNKKNR